MTGRRYWNWRIALFFALVGPPLGGMVLGMTPVLAGLLAFFTRSPQSFPGPELLPMLLAFSMFSYVPGFVPAFMTGLLVPVVWALSRMSLQRNCVYRIVTGGFMGAVNTYLFMLFLSRDSILMMKEDMFFRSLLMLCGATSAAICSAIAGRWLDDVQSSGRRQRPVTNTDFDVSGGQA